jgi:uncharacterized protein with PQ loop repeat
MPPQSTAVAANVLGTLGGLLLSVCLLPQLWRIWKTRSAADLDYGWMALYGAGLAVNTAYLILVKAPVGAAFHAVELVLVLVMVAAKAGLERRVGTRAAGAGSGGKVDGGGGGDHPPSPAGGRPPVPPTRPSGEVV